MLQRLPVDAHQLVALLDAAEQEADRRDYVRWMAATMAERPGETRTPGDILVSLTAGGWPAEETFERLVDGLTDDELSYVAERLEATFEHDEDLDALSDEGLDRRHAELCKHPSRRG